MICYLALKNRDRESRFGIVSFAGLRAPAREPGPSVSPISATAPPSAICMFKLPLNEVVIPFLSSRPVEFWLIHCSTIILVVCLVCVTK